MTYPITIATLFPDMFPGALGHSITGRGLKENLWSLSTVDIRQFGLGKHKSVDDTPYGGGAGMLMRADVVAETLRHAKKAQPNAKTIYLSPAGKPFKQEDARRLASEKGGIILLCGHYEGVDQRAIEAEVDEELSIGDYVLTGGELAAMVMADAVIRNIPEVLGGEDTLKEESFDITTPQGEQLIEYPHYTRPDTWEGKEVPAVLKSGHHGEIEKWRHSQALERTAARRPDLLKKT